jgi:hypothetical protein
MKKYFLVASVTVPTDEGFYEFADRLSRVIPGFTFEADTSGYYEEVPACVAWRAEMRFILFGTPEDEVHDGEYVLDFECETDLPLEALPSQDPSGFVRRVVGHKTPSQRGYINCSQELAQFVTDLGIPGCKPIRPVEP